MKNNQFYVFFRLIKAAYINKWQCLRINQKVNHKTESLCKLLQNLNIIASYRTNKNYTLFVVSNTRGLSKPTYIKLFKKTQHTQISIKLLNSYFSSNTKHLFLLNSRKGLITSLQAMRLNCGGKLIGVIY